MQSSSNSIFLRQLVDESTRVLCGYVVCFALNSNMPTIYYKEGYSLLLLLITKLLCMLLTTINRANSYLKMSRAMSYAGRPGGSSG